MADLTDKDIDAALERGKVVNQTEPRAIRARYDTRSDRMILDLNNGCSFAFPPKLVQGLEDAGSGELAEVEILGSGLSLHWEARDVDISVPGLLAGIFGTRSYLARKAGKVTSPAKSAAARANGAKGGRPRKVAG